MTIPTKHHTQIGQLQSFFVGLLLALIIAISPSLAQADILQETFGNGYGFLSSHEATRPLETPKRPESTTQGTTLQKTFGEGYALVRQEPSTLTTNPQTLTTIDVTIKDIEIPPKEPPISVFHSLMNDGYGAAIHSSQRRPSN